MALKLSVIGTGYLGATHAACMSSLGFEVIGFDTEVTRSNYYQKVRYLFMSQVLRNYYLSKLSQVD